MRTRKGLALPALLVSIALVASACRKVERPREPLTKGLFRVEEGEPGSLDPPHADDSTEIVVVKNIFEGLVTYDDKTAAVGPGMATKWEQNPEATQFTFTLRRDATFSNGEPVTAESFVRGWTRATAREEDAELAYHLSGIKGYKEHHDAGTAANLEGVVAKDRFTLEVTLSGPDPEFVIKSGHVAFMPVPKQQTIRAQNPSWGEFPIGNGPFMLKGPEPWKHNQSITMVPNAKYRGGRPRPSLSEVRFVVFQDLETAYAEWQAGNLDWTHVPPGKLKEAEEKNPGNFLKRTSAGLTYLDTITDKAPTNNKLFRQAISLAVDREAINQAIFNGLQQPADSIIPPRMPGYRQGACKFCTYDPARAKQLFKDSKVRIRGKLAIYLNAGAGHEEWMQAVGAQIKTNLGIDYQIATKGPPFSEYLKFLRSKEVPGSVNRLAWSMDYPTPQNFLFPLLHSASNDNYSRYKNPVYEDLLADAAREHDPASRIPIYHQAEDLALEELPIIPLWFRVQFRLVRQDTFGGLAIDSFEDPTLTTALKK